MKYKNRLRFMSTKQKAAVQHIEEFYSPFRKNVNGFLYALVPSWFLYALVGLLVISIPLHFPIIALAIIALLLGIVVCYLGLLTITQGWYFQSRTRMFIQGAGSIAIGVAYNLFGIWIMIAALGKM